MDPLEFECPSCNGSFTTVLTDVEVTCPHCGKKSCLGAFDFSSLTDASLVAKPITTAAPLFPPGYKKSIATDSSTPPATIPDELPPAIIVDDDVDKSGDDTESFTPPATIPDELPPVAIVDDDVDKSGDDTESFTPPATIPDELPPAIIVDDDADKSGDDPESFTPPATVPDELPPVAMIDEDVDESPVILGTNTAIDDLLPPSFHMDDDQIATHIDRHETTEATALIDVRVDAEPVTVGRGINERELRSRTPDEKNQFMRKKNIIVWVIGAFIIIVTMIVMLQLA